MRPVTAQPGYVEADVDALLASLNFVFTDCYTVTPIIGSPLYLTDASRNVTVVPLGGSIRRTYVGGTVLIKGLRSHMKIGVEVDDQQVNLDYTNEPDYQARLPWPRALLLGYLDGATIRRDRFIAGAWGDDLDYPWVGGMPMFDGIVSGLTEVGRQSATISVKSALNVLDTQMPRDLFRSRCKNQWGDLNCGVDQSAFASTVTITSGTPTTTFLPWTGAGANYVEGKVHIDNGDSVTRVRKIQRADATGLWLVYPLDFAPEIGSTFTAFPGCGGTMTECEAYHGSDWRDHFKGMPFIPVVESAL
jgi:hypothetical protein